MLDTLKTSLLGLAALAGVALVFPSQWTKPVEAMVRTQMGKFDEESCDRNKIACLRSKHGQLTETVAKLDRVRNSLMQNLSQVDGVVEEKTKLLSGNEALLHEGRQLANQRGQQGASGPVTFAGRGYTQEMFNAQLSLLLKERKSLQKIVDAARQQKTSMEQQVLDVMLRRGEAETARQLLPSQIALLDAQLATEDLQESYKTIKNVLSLADHSIDQALASIGSTKELLHDIASGKSGGVTVRDEEVERFLKEGLNPAQPPRPEPKLSRHEGQKETVARRQGGEAPVVAAKPAATACPSETVAQQPVPEADRDYQKLI